MGSLIEHLRSFNRKERFYVVAQALQDSTSFTLHPRFLGRLEATFGIRIPSDYFAAMDYHLDWLYAGLYLANGGPMNPPPAIDDLTIEGNQEDIDFLVAFEDETGTHLVILEAKGTTGWTNGQMVPKAKRLGAILGGPGGGGWTSIPGLTPHFALWSPRDQRDLILGEWPQWMKAKTCPGEDGKLAHRPHWIPLQLPQRKRVTRCDRDPSQGMTWGRWTVVDD